MASKSLLNSAVNVWCGNLIILKASSISLILVPQKHINTKLKMEVILLTFSYHLNGAVTNSDQKWHYF